MAENKKRRRWLLNSDNTILSTNEGEFNLNDIEPEGELFLRLYGLKQYLADSVANRGGTEYSNDERLEFMQEKYDNLCNDKFRLTKTESGFYFKDPDAVAKRGGIKQSALYEGLIEMGKTHEEAIEFIAKIKS